VSRLLQRQKDLNNVNDMLGALHKSVARASALPDYKEKKAEYVRGPCVLCSTGWIACAIIAGCFCLPPRPSHAYGYPGAGHICCGL
jgi:hypothetical protein